MDDKAELARVIEAFSSDVVDRMERIGADRHHRIQAKRGRVQGQLEKMKDWVFDCGYNSASD